MGQVVTDDAPGHTVHDQMVDDEHQSPGGLGIAGHPARLPQHTVLQVHRLSELGDQLADTLDPLRIGPQARRRLGAQPFVRRAVRCHLEPPLPLSREPVSHQSAAQCCVVIDNAAKYPRHEFLVGTRGCDEDCGLHERTEGR